MSLELPVKCLAGEVEVLGENLPQCHFVHHKYNLNYGMAGILVRGI
jgi:sterol desaturase/sphingolipid hydroxylase (fatty acid hydroxylase superfamily)